jgi:hypothetical protein
VQGPLVPLSRPKRGRDRSMQQCLPQHSRRSAYRPADGWFRIGLRQNFLREVAYGDTGWRIRGQKFSLGPVRTRYHARCAERSIRRAARRCGDLPALSPTGDSSVR